MSNEFKAEAKYYFKENHVIVKTSYLIRHVFKKPNLARRMMSYEMELFEYDIQYIPRGSIKLQVLSNFLVKFSSLEGEETPHIWVWFMDDTLNLKGISAK